MTQVSKVKLDKKIEKELSGALELILARVSEKDMNSFMLAFFTPTERLMLAKRLAAIILIKENVAHSHISSTLRLTRVTVAKLEMLVELNSERFEPVFKILKHEKLLVDLKKTLLKIVSYSVRASGGYVKPTIV